MHDIAIVGTGLINGKNLYKDWAHGDKQGANKAIGLVRCRNVIIRDISILHGGWFGILATGIDNFTLDNVKFDTNRDGMPQKSTTTKEHDNYNSATIRA